MFHSRYEESMLNCCGSLEEVSATTLCEILVYLNIIKYSSIHVRPQVKKTGITFSSFACLARCQGLNVNIVYGSTTTVDEFRKAVKQSCIQPPNIQTQPTSFLIVSYNRQVLGQTGTGHFSPIGAYDEASDHVLVLDTARFKYGKEI